MIKTILRRGRDGVLLATIIAGLASPAWAAMLITSEEAALAPVKVVDGSSRAVARGPVIEQVSPAPGAVVTSPFHLVVRFHPRNDVPVALDTATLVYGRAPLKDITERVDDYMTAAGIDVPSVEAPPGEHWLRVRVRDEHLNWTTSWIKITVVQQAADAGRN